MPDDPRIVKLESNVQYLQSDVTEIKANFGSLRAAIDALTREFLSFKAEVAQEFGSLRAPFERESEALRTSFEQGFGSLRTASEREFGSLRTAIERAKLWMVVTGVGTILSVWGAAFALARFLKP